MNKKKYYKTHRDKFLDARAEDVAKAKAYAKAHPEENHIVVDAYDEIICDYCNAEIVEEFVFCDDYGASCPECRVGAAIDCCVEAGLTREQATARGRGRHELHSLLQAARELQVLSE